MSQMSRINVLYDINNGHSLELYMAILVSKETRNKGMRKEERKRVRNYHFEIIQKNHQNPIINLKNMLKTERSFIFYSFYLQ